MNDVFMVMALAGGAGTLVILLTIIMDRCWDWITGAGLSGSARNGAARLKRMAMVSTVAKPPALMICSSSS